MNSTSHDKPVTSPPTEPESDTRLADEPPESRPAEQMTETTPKRARRGFAAMSPDKVREIAHKGGIAAHEKGTAHRFTQDEAREAGRKGGRAPHRVRGRKLPDAAA